MENEKQKIEMENVCPPSASAILDSGPCRIALLPAHLNGGSSTCCSDSGSLHVRVGLVGGWASSKKQ